MKIKTTTLSSVFIDLKTRELLWTAGLLSVAIIAPLLLAHTSANQWITGTVVNTVLFLAAYRLKLFNAILIAILPSSVALMRGLLPAPMAIVIPYIITANILLIMTFQLLNTSAFTQFLKSKKELLLLISVLFASSIKFIFLTGIVSFVLIQLNNPLIFMLTWPQLFTALAGGLISLLLIRFFFSK